MDVQAVTQSLSSLSVDWIIVVAVALLIFFDGLRSGVGRAAAVSLAFPLTALFFGEISHATLIGSLATQFTTPALEAALFGALFLGAYVILRRIVPWYGDVSSSIVMALLAAVATTAISIVFWLDTPVLNTLWHFGPHVQGIFGAGYRFWWLAAGFVALAFARS